MAQPTYSLRATVFAKKLTTIEGGIVWNDDNEVSYASPSIRY